MDISYYPETDSLWIQLKKGKYVESEEIAPGFVVDFDENGDVLAIDIDSEASKLVDINKINFERVEGEKPSEKKS